MNQSEKFQCNSLYSLAALLSTDLPLAGCVQLAQVALQIQYPLNDQSPIVHCGMHLHACNLC